MFIKIFYIIRRKHITNNYKKYILFDPGRLFFTAYKTLITLSRMLNKQINKLIYY